MIFEILIFHAFVIPTFSLEPNLLLSLKSIKNDSITASASYNLYKLKDNPFHLLDKANFIFVQTVNAKKRGIKLYTLIVDINGENFTKTTNETKFEFISMSNMYYTILEYEFDDILKFDDIFFFSYLNVKITQINMSADSWF